MDSLIELLIHWLDYWFIDWIIDLFIYWLIELLIYLFIDWIIDLLIELLIYWFIDLLIYWLNYWFIDWIINTLIELFFLFSSVHVWLLGYHLVVAGMDPTWFHCRQWGHRSWNHNRIWTGKYSRQKYYCYHQNTK